MSCHPRVTEWTTIIHAHLPHLSKPQATVLALWSLGMVLARSCALTAVSLFLATGWSASQHGAPTVAGVVLRSERQTRAARQELAVETCFAPLLAWVVSRWEGTQLALAVDATTLGNGLWCWW